MSYDSALFEAREALKLRLDNPTNEQIVQAANGIYLAETISGLGVSWMHTVWEGDGQGFGGLRDIFSTIRDFLKNKRWQ